MKKVLHVDENHPILAQLLADHGFKNEYAYTQSKTEILNNITDYEGLIIRSRFKLDKAFLKAATNLKFIGRVGAGLENIDLKAAAQLDIQCYNAPEGNRNAVGEHALGLLLSLLNNIVPAHNEVLSGIWQREENRGVELDSQVVGLIGYGNMGKSFARKLSGFNCEVLCHDIKNDVGDEYARQVPLATLQEKATVVSLHTPQTPQTIGLINSTFIDKMAAPFFLINTARGKSVVTAHLVNALNSGKVLGAGLDVLEYESSSFTSLFNDDKMPAAYTELLKLKQVVLSPHVAGWTVQSKELLASTIAHKIIENHKHGS